MFSRLICGGLIGLAVLAGSVSAQTVLYVDVDATDPPDGKVSVDGDRSVRS